MTRFILASDVQRNSVDNAILLWESSVMNTESAPMTTESMPMDEPVEDELLRACRDCGRSFMPLDADDRYCRACTEVDEVERDQNGFRIRSEHIPHDH